MHELSCENMKRPPASTRLVAFCRWPLALIIFSLFLSGGCDLEPDAKLMEVFDKNISDFRRLAIMSEQDRHVVRIDFNFTALDTDSSWPRKDLGFSEQRWEEYRTLFRKLGITSGLERQNDGTSILFFYARCEGSAVSRDCKGYAYSERPLKPIKDNLNKLAPGLAFRPLSPNWYLFRDGG